MAASEGGYRDAGSLPRAGSSKTVMTEEIDKADFEKDLLRAGMGVQFVLSKIEDLVQGDGRVYAGQVSDETIEIYKDLAQRLRGVEEFLERGITHCEKPKKDTSTLDVFTAVDFRNRGAGAVASSNHRGRSNANRASIFGAIGSGPVGVGDFQARPEVAKAGATARVAPQEDPVRIIDGDIDEIDYESGDESEFVSKEKQAIAPPSEAAVIKAPTKCERWKQKLKLFLPPKIMPPGEKYIKAKFEEIDADASGELEREEVAMLLEDEGLTPEESADVLAQFDSDGGGTIQWAEFRRVIMGSELWRRELTIAETVYLTCDDASSSGLAQCIFWTVFTCILLAVLSMIFESIEEYKVVPDGCNACLTGISPKEAKKQGLMSCEYDCEPHVHDFFIIIDLITVPVFTFEYLCRLCTIHAVKFMDFSLNKRKMNDDSIRVKIAKTWEFATDSLNILDLLSIVPFYIELAMKGWDPFNTSAGNEMNVSGVLRVLRISRVFRVLKLGKTSAGMGLFVQVMKQSSNALRIIFFFLVVSMILFGVVIYEIEKGEWRIDSDVDGCDRGCYVRPSIDFSAEQSPFRSIPMGFWWVLVTQTTVGYGDLVPTSVVGKLVGVVTMLMGVLVLALPITVIGANFAREYTNREDREAMYAEAQLEDLAPEEKYKAQRRRSRLKA